VALEALPMTATGKLDRRSLPSPTWARAEEEGAVAAPRSRVERLVAEILADVLGREQIGLHDNFFDLGGHSLLVIRVLSRVRALFQAELPVRSVFERPTAAGLAECIEQAVSTAGRLQSPVRGDSGEREELEV